MRASLFFVLVLVLSRAAGALAQEPPTPEELAEARSMYEQGATAYEQEAWALCAVYFERSFAIVFAPELLFNVGRCYDRAAHVEPREDFLRRAIAAYTRYLQEVPDAEGVGDVQGRLLVLRQVLGRLREIELESADVAPAPVAVVEVERVQARVVQAPEAPAGFAWTWTAAGGAAAAIAGLVAVILGSVATVDYEGLVRRCGDAPAGCTEGDAARVEALATSANAFWGIGGVFAATTGVSFGVELDVELNAPGGEAALRVRVGGSF